VAGRQRMETPITPMADRQPPDWGISRRHF
jgi:hypothetical protein